MLIVSEGEKEFIPLMRSDDDEDLSSVLMCRGLVDTEKPTAARRIEDNGA